MGLLLCQQIRLPVSQPTCVYMVASGAGG
jgi:hypothetical protein